MYILGGVKAKHSVHTIKSYHKMYNKLLLAGLFIPIDVKMAVSLIIGVNKKELGLPLIVGICRQSSQWCKQMAQLWSFYIYKATK